MPALTVIRLVAGTTVVRDSQRRALHHRPKIARTSFCFGLRSPAKRAQRTETTHVVDDEHHENIASHPTVAPRNVSETSASAPRTNYGNAKQKIEHAGDAKRPAT